MVINELKCIEALLTSLIYNSNEDKFNKSVDNSSNFRSTCNNLFNILSINTLVRNYRGLPSFSLKKVFEIGSFSNRLEDNVVPPEIDLRYQGSYNEFFYHIIKALKEGNYTFDEHSNILVSSKDVETILNPAFLYKLSQAIKNDKFEMIYLYNKHHENDISDENALLNYLYNTKTFSVEMSSTKTGTDYNQAFIKAKLNTEEKLKGNKAVKVDQVIDTFQSYIAPEIKTTINKFKMPQSSYIINKANKMGERFYSKSISEQKELITSWLIEYLNVNQLSTDQLQSFLYTNEDLVLVRNKGNLISGLFCLYMTILTDLNMDFEQISLINFKIKEFVSESQQQHLIDVNEIIKEINKYEESDSKKELLKTINERFKLLKSRDPETLDTVYAAEVTEVNNLLTELKANEASHKERLEMRNSLQNIIRYEQEHDEEDLAFDNNRIIYLISESCNKGRVYTSKNKRGKVVVELYNTQLGRIIFQSEISLEKLLSFIENVNYTIEEQSPRRLMTA